jgi:outer membrane autotransporter protein
MKTKPALFRLIALPLLLIAAAAGHPARAANIVWTGTGDGASRDWFTASNWSNNAVPVGTGADTTIISSTLGPILTTGTADARALRVGEIMAGVADGDGRLEITGDARLNITSGIGIANAAARTGSVIISGTGILSSSAHIYVGYNGTGILEMTDHATFTVLGSAATGLAQNAGSTGIATLSDSALWEVASGGFYAGLRSTGTMTLRDTARVNSLTFFSLATNPTAIFTVDASGTSVITATTYANLADNGAGTLALRGRASLTAGGTVAIASGTGAGDVTLSGSALLRAGTVLVVGGSGKGTLTLRDGGFVQAGSGTLTLAASANSTGLLEITGSTAGLITGTNGASPVTITAGAGTGGARVVFSHSDASYTFANNLAGTLAVEHNGPGLTTLTGSAGHTGGTIVRGGTLAGNAANLRGAITTESAATLLFDQAAAGSFAGTLSGAGTLAKTGTADLTLADDALADFTGMLDARAGSLVLNATATVSNDLSIAPSATLEFNTGAAALAWDGTFAAANAAAAGTLRKTGAGSLAFTTPGLAFAGTLAISQGAVTLTPGARLGALTIGSGASFSGAGAAVAGDVSINNGTLTLQPGSGALAIGGDFTLANSTLEIGLFDAGDSIITIGGAAIISGANTIDLTPGMSGTYTLAGLESLDTATVTIGGAPQVAGSRQTATAAAVGADLQIFFEADISRRLTWTGSDSANWNITEDNWSGSNDTTAFAVLDTVVFDGTGDAANPARRTIALAGAMRVSDMIVAGDADYTFAGAGAILSGTTIVTETGNPDNLAGVTGRLIKSGAGTLTFANTGANNFTGGIEISGGAIVFNDTAQLGTDNGAGAPAPISFAGAGGTLSGAGMLAAGIDIAATAILDTAGTLALAGPVTGDGALEKTGAGTLVLAAENTHTGAIAIAAGTLATRAENLRGPVVNNATLVLHSDTAAAAGTAIAAGTGAAADDTFATTLTGDGALSKTGAGTLALAAAASLAARDITLAGGAIVLTPAARLAAAAPFTIAAGAALLGTGAITAPVLNNAGAIRVGRAADPSAPHGTLTLQGDYTAAAGAEIRLDMSLNPATGVIEHDRFIIDGDITAGAVTRVSLQEQPSADRLRGDTSLLPAFSDMLAVTGAGDLAAAFAHEGIVEFGGGQYTYDPAANAGAGGWTVQAAEPVSAIGALDAAALLIGKASFDSLSNRILATRENAPAPAKKQIWLAGFQRREKLATVRYDRHDTAPRADADTQGIQAGLDWISVLPQYTFALGAFADYAKSDMHLPRRASTGTVRATGAGAYAAWKINRWHIRAIFRQSKETYDITAARVAPFETSGYTWGGLLAAGAGFKPAARWRLEPEAQLAYQTHNIKDVTDAAGRRYVVENAASLDARAGLRLAREIVFQNGVKLIPRLRASYLYDFDSDCRLRVADELFRNNLGGAGAEIDFGLAAELGRGTALQLNAAWRHAKATQGATLAASFAHAW